MKAIKLFVLGILAWAGTTSCERETVECRDDFPVLFQYEYVNHAWGYRHRGFMIDAQGQVLGFDRPKDWKFPDSMGFLSEKDLRFNMEYCDTICGQVDPDEAWRYYGKLRSMSDYKIEDTGVYMADAGTGVLSGWVYSYKEKTYKNVVLATNGDMNMVNNHPDANSIIEWLKSVGEKSNLYWWYGK